ncbi:isoleucine--tRNA ligase, cytoplasmic-like [Eriocheir sinensis]|uniref:isoleucine--tRNA ligase, cytoplasmic-like n=1 Tax=Eriocheir sinensis TaxID=95602 RepID=UPI0021C68010|nr:isoleucine--tRNA ligase, cytoplasmic-like [Eriocheir sinensis]XP_050714887.1 isoleucine--tRNA ligase, cytoplasmic-like [Eriocheir sinensis]XP_050714888.1 isoleucine--tRNA ligase, cytoplasmic-like [Eriocheir sinensis]XP_050714889.1 isoleucine--tRNA ligase, cytoplasmic-like [Eriocheir sinensis]
MEEQLQPVPEVDQKSFNTEEHKILELWKKLDVFHTCLKQSKDRPRFTFYDGPPFATGLPHYGHILAGTIKDVVTRWAHQNGYHVERRFGWDTHGLPVEYEIDKTHGITGPEDVAAMGIKKYNELCRGIVSRYADEWEQIVNRLGRWIDFRNDYKTLYPWFMESVWWVFAQLFQKGLVYRGFKVMPFSTACSTPLSNFEAGQNYKDTQDPSVVVSFPVVGQEGVVLVAWTTTPWTLPSNMALCVNPELDYVKIQGKIESRSGTYILMEARIKQLFKEEDDYEVLAKFKGRELEGTQYTPLFDYFKHRASRGAFKVLCDGYVSAESGTGVVHQAPYFGEDDFRVCLSYGLIDRDDEDPICPVDDAGRFMPAVRDFQGRHVKEADPAIIKELQSRGRLVVAETVNHSYPFCWRSDTPLIYRAVPSWFIRVEQMQDRLLEANEKTYWVPGFVKDKRFANWLRDARDWAVSRKRYWGTPIPLWTSEDFSEVVCISSIEELERLTGEKVTDLHRDSIDHLTIPSARPGQPPLKRVMEVFDCWFESGSMPYAQVHYPFERRREFEDCFPADFIAEGIDQTRGWFYTLLVLSTALFGKPPFKNLIVNGLVLAEDGQKMSKRKKNYPDPMEVVDEYGADALRLYLTNSPAVRGENLRFKKSEVLALMKEVFVPWLNAYRFFVQQVHRYEKEEGERFLFKGDASMGLSANVMDRWILSFTQSLLGAVHKEMAAYRLYNVTPRLVKFVDNLTNWYVRFNRRRLKGDGGKEDCLRALDTLCAVLLCMVRVMAPFTPFITETMYQNLRRVVQPGALGEGDTASVHYLSVPQPIASLVSPEVEASVTLLQSVVELGRYLRDRHNLPLKYPLREVVVVVQGGEGALHSLRTLEDYIKEELNVRTLTTSTDRSRYGVTLTADVNFRNLGARLKGDVKAVQRVVCGMSDIEVQGMLERGTLDILGHTLLPEDVVVKYGFGGTGGCYEAHADSSALVLLDTTPSEELQAEGLAREVVNRIQRLRKKARLVPTDEVTVWLAVSDTTSQLAQIVTSHTQFIEATSRTPCKVAGVGAVKGEVVIQEKCPVKDCDLVLTLTRGIPGSTTATAPSKPTTPASTSATAAGGAKSGPACPWVNVVLDGTPRRGAGSCSATLLLENPVGRPVVASVAELLEEARALFGFPAGQARLHVERQPLRPDAPAAPLSGKTLVITYGKEKVPAATSALRPYSRYINVEHGGSTNGLRGCVVLENPCGGGVLPQHTLAAVLQKIFGLPPSTSPPKLFSDQAKTSPIKFEALVGLSGKTVYV